MKKTLLILILTLGMCSINVNAQMRELKTEENGYQWYEIYKDGISGAEGKDGRLLIPLSRGYNTIIFETLKKEIGYFLVIRDLKYGVCDITGKEIIVPNKYDFVHFREVEGHAGYYSVKNNSGVGACDITGKEIIPCQYDEISYSDGFKCKTYAGNYITMNIKLDKKGTSFNKVFQSYTDAQAFGLKGKVEKCLWLKSARDKYYLKPMGNSLLFDETGKIKWASAIIIRDKNGRIEKMKDEVGRNELDFEYNSDGLVSRLYLSPQSDDTGAALLMTIFDFEYDNKGNVITVKEYDAASILSGDEPNEVVNIKYTEFDEKGNWKKREYECKEFDVSSMTMEKNKYNESRIINYY